MSNVAIFGPISAALTQRLQQQFQAKTVPTGDNRAHWMAQHASQVQVAVVTYTHGMTRQLIEQLPNLEAVVNFGVGYDSSDLLALAQHGIGLANTPDVLTECVADTAVALAMDTMRQLSAADRFVRSSHWLQGGYPLTRRFWGTPVGILGLGRIGKAIARRLEGFQCPISYYQRHQDLDVTYRYFDNPLTLAQNVRLLIAAVPGGSDTHHLVDTKVLSALGSDGFFVNIARGSVVDEAALIEALESGEIAGAGLDVFQNEPHVPQKLLELDNVVLLPHVGSATEETRTDMGELVVQNIASWLEQHKLVTPV